MLKKTRVRTLMDSQHVKVSETLVKSARLYICDIFWSLWKKTSSGNSLLVVSIILILFVNILTHDDKYSVSVKASALRNQFKCNYLKIKKKNWNFLCISKIYIRFGILWKKRWVSEVICFINFRFQKQELLKCRKNSVSEHLWTVKILKRPKDSLNLHGTIFVIFFKHSERISAGKILFQ